MKSTIRPRSTVSETWIYDTCIQCYFYWNSYQKYICKYTKKRYQILKTPSESYSCMSVQNFYRKGHILCSTILKIKISSFKLNDYFRLSNLQGYAMCLFNVHNERWFHLQIIYYISSLIDIKMILANIASSLTKPQNYCLGKTGFFHHSFLVLSTKLSLDDEFNRASFLLA